MGIIMNDWRRTTLETTGNFEFLRHVLLKKYWIKFIFCPTQNREYIFYVYQQVQTHHRLKKVLALKELPYAL